MHPSLKHTPISITCNPRKNFGKINWWLPRKFIGNQKGIFKFSFYLVHKLGLRKKRVNLLALALKYFIVHHKCSPTFLQCFLTNSQKTQLQVFHKCSPTFLQCFSQILKRPSYKCFINVLQHSNNASHRFSKDPATSAS